MFKKPETLKGLTVNLVLGLFKHWSFNWCVFSFKKMNKRTKKPVDWFLQDGASAGIRSLKVCIVMKLCHAPENGPYTLTFNFSINQSFSISLIKL